MTILEQIGLQFIVPVVRQTDSALLEGAALALAAGGLKVLEITLMSDAAFDVIGKLSKQNDVIVGAGTVLTKNQAQKAVDSGARFLISPGLNLEIVEFAKKSSVLLLPGILTPTEIMQAHAAGCDVFKIFPVSAVGGPAYIKMLRGPFPTFKWIPTGGISLENLSDYRAAGAFAVGMGGQLIPDDLVRSKSWQALTAIAATHVRGANAGS